jgi:hypothetical protein
MEVLMIKMMGRKVCQLFRELIRVFSIKIEFPILKLSIFPQINNRKYNKIESLKHIKYNLYEQTKLQSLFSV